MRRGWQIALVWLAVSVLSATQSVIGMRTDGMQHNWPRLSVAMMLQWLVWAAATPALIELGRRVFPSTGNTARPVLIHIGVWLLISITSASWVAAVRMVIQPWAPEMDTRPYLQIMKGFWHNNVHVSIILYSAILAVSRSVAARDRLAEQEVQLASAQQEVFRKQIEPHFLFNSLHGIAGLVRDGRNDRAVEMIVGLGDLLRQVMEGSRKQMAPLGEEIDFVRRYLEIQRMRFEDRLRVEWDVSEAAMPLPVPSLILQPLVENALLHGIAKRVEGGLVKVSTAVGGERLTLSVVNDGSLASKVEEGVGLGSTRARLKAIYGELAKVELRAIDDGKRVETVVTLPVRP